MTDVIKMEWIKLRSLRSTGWIMAIFAAGMVGLAILVMSKVNWAHWSAADRAEFDPTEEGFVGLALGQLVIGVMGAMIISGEYSSGMIRATLAAVPRRSRLLAAKAVVLAAVTLLAGEVLAFAGFLAGQAALPSGAPHATLGQPGVLRAVLMAGAYPCLIALIALGLGAVIRHTAGTIGALVGVIFVLPLVLLPFGGGHGTAQKFLPETIAENSITAVKPVTNSLGPWTGLGMLCLYAAVALAAGAMVLRRRDA